MEFSTDFFLRNRTDKNRAPAIVGAY